MTRLPQWSIANPKLRAILSDSTVRKVGRCVKGDATRLQYVWCLYYSIYVNTCAKTKTSCRRYNHIMVDGVFDIVELAKRLKLVHDLRTGTLEQLCLLTFGTDVFV